MWAGEGMVAKQDCAGDGMVPVSLHDPYPPLTFPPPPSSLSLVLSCFRYVGNVPVPSPIGVVFHAPSGMVFVGSKKNAADPASGPSPSLPDPLYFF